MPYQPMVDRSGTCYVCIHHLGSNPYRMYNWRSRRMCQSETRKLAQENNDATLFDAVSRCLLPINQSIDRLLPTYNARTHAPHLRHQPQSYPGGEKNRSFPSLSVPRVTLQWLRRQRKLFSAQRQMPRRWLLPAQVHVLTGRKVGVLVWNQDNFLTRLSHARLLLSSFTSASALVARKFSWAKKPWFRVVAVLT